jgi:hypothetical protein
MPVQFENHTRPLSDSNCAGNSTGEHLFEGEPPMDILNLGADASVVRSHIELFALLLLGLPAISFLTMKFWLATRAASKVQRTTEWVVPQHLESEGARSLRARPARTSLMVHQIESQRRHAAATKIASLKRSA